MCPLTSLLPFLTHPPHPLSPTHHAGATKTQVADQSDRLVAAVTKLLGPAASELFVAGVSGGAAASLSTAGASEEGGALKVQSIPSGQPPSGPALLNDGFMQFEGPTYEGSTLSIQSAEPSKPHKGSKGGGVGALSMEGTGAAPPLTVVLAAFGADPLAIYKHAGDPARWVDNGWAQLLSGCVREVMCCA